MKNDFQIRPPPILINQIRQKNSKLWVYELIRLEQSGYITVLINIDLFGSWT